MKQRNMMTTGQLENVTQLRQWPVIGKFYSVPCIYIEHCGLATDWPVYGPAHIDNTRAPSPQLSADFLRRFLHAPHFHVDPRFLTPEMEDALAAQWSNNRQSMKPGKAVLLDSEHPDHIKAALTFGLGNLAGWAPRPALRPMKCVRSVVRWDVGARDREWISEHKYTLDFGSPQPAIQSEDGLPMCPHHALNLHCVWDGVSETVRCPMHGLEVDMRGCRRDCD